MRRVVSCAQMKALDAVTIQELRVPSMVLMERAALKTADEIRKYCEAHTAVTQRVLVVCGSGNNGGDGIAVARLLHLAGVASTVFLAGSPEKMTEQTALQWEIAKNYHVPVTNNPKMDEYTIIVDAIFGVGLARPVSGHYAELIRQMNASSAFKVSVDLPSGMDGDTGQELGIAFRADLTVTFAFLKSGLCLYPGRTFAGKVIAADIGIYEKKDPDSGENTASPDGKKQDDHAGGWQLEETDLSLLKKRRRDGNKGTFGKVLIAAGSDGMCGAAYFSAAAALGSGTGMVKLQTTEKNQIPLQTLLPEAMLSVSESEEAYRDSFAWCDTVVIGPGMGISAESTRRASWFLKAAWEAGKPVVLDADGLNLLSAHPEWKQWLTCQTVLTPHLGEMSRLSGKTIGELKKDLPAAAAAYAKENHCIVVLKDAGTVTAGWDGTCFYNLSGDPCMAAAGSGDVLSGILGACLCLAKKGEFLTGRQEELRPDLLLAAAYGVFIHGLCGERYAKNYGSKGMKAGDLLAQLPEVINKK